METIEPISYVYDPAHPDERQVAILGQVKTYCQIPETQTDSETWAYIWQVLRRISVLDCWADKPNDTFISQVRTQRFELKQVNACCRGCCVCDEDIVKIPLAYEPVVGNGYISGKITVVIGGRIVTQDVDPEYLAEHTDWETGILYINREDFPEILLYRGNCCCLCNRNLRIDLVYNAGYDMIPSGLLPVVCKLLEKVDTNKSDECASAMSTVAGPLKAKKVGNVEYQWSDADKSIYNINKLVADLDTIGVLGEVMVYSRCSLSDYEAATGAIV